MTISIAASHALWDSFLQRWPLEYLPQMTLEEYTKAGDTDCFTYGWLEQRTEQLGSIWGGSAFKFGVYSRKDKSNKSGGAGRCYSTDYGWYAKYGDTIEAAFARVRDIICEVARAARAGDLDTVQKADLGAAIKWKIAFLYQDRVAPTVLPIFSADHLAAWLETRSRRNGAALHAAAMAKRGDADVFSFGAQIWEKAEARLAAMTLNPDDALAFFQECPERFQPIKEPTKYIAGFTTTEGRCLALARDAKGVKLWLEPGAWLDAVKGQLKDIEEYPAERARNSNLGANAPQLAQGNPAIYLAVPTRAALLALCDAYDNTDLEDNNTMPSAFPNATSAKVPLNQILYGPPGTGKTFATIDETLRILDPAFLQEHGDQRDILKARFDALAASEQVRFVTFHQSFSYEDFVEGLRALTNDDKQLEYVVEPGVFKRLCDDARTQGVQQDVGIRSNPRIWKISINGGGQSATKSYCLTHGEARIGWGKTGDLRGSLEDSAYYQSLGTSDRGTLRYFEEEMAPGDILLCIHSAETIGAIGVVTGDYRFDATTPAGIIDGYQHVRSVNWLYRDLQLSILPLNDGKQFTLKTVYAMDRFSWGDLLSYLEQSGAVPSQPVSVSAVRKPYVLIIDEINRGNISRIFGELITLIEPSKRAGADEALSVTLPYSKKPFSVPSNVYLIGTMNTADRSLAGLDIALRRRFTFKEMPPQPDLLEGVAIEDVNVGQLLRKMNERIEVLLGRDHCLGHAYFMPLKEKPTLAELGRIFQQQILPLLQEYFFEDWERIAWILNNHGKHAAPAFVEKASTNLASLFGAALAETLENADRRWRINGAAFENIDSYRRILGDAA